MSTRGVTITPRAHKKSRLLPGWLEAPREISRRPWHAGGVHQAFMGAGQVPTHRSARDDGCRSLSPLLHPHPPGDSCYTHLGKACESDPFSTSSSIRTLGVDFSVMNPCETLLFWFYSGPWSEHAGTNRILYVHVLYRTFCSHRG